MKSKRDGGFLGALMAASLIVPMASSLKQHLSSSLINGNRVMRAGKGHEDVFFTSLVLLLMIKAILEKEVCKSWNRI